MAGNPAGHDPAAHASCSGQHPKGRTTMNLLLDLLAGIAHSDRNNGAAPLTGTTTMFTNEEANHYNLNFFDKK